jgi:hypothetical protein
VEEYWEVKPEYQEWSFGRVEIFRNDEEWAIDELRFCTPPTKEWIDFREEWDFKDVDELETFKKLLVLFQKIPPKKTNSPP